MAELGKCKNIQLILDLIFVIEDRWNDDLTYEIIFVSAALLWILRVGAFGLFFGEGGWGVGGSIILRFKGGKRKEIIMILKLNLISG